MLSFSPRRWAKQCVALLNHSRPAKRRPRDIPLTLECLEDRCVPSAPGTYSGLITTNTAFNQSGTYEINGNLTVESGVTLTVGQAGQNVKLVIDPGVTLKDDGALILINSVPVALGGPVNVTTKILVDGVMNASGATFIGNNNNEFGLNEIEVASGGELTSSGSTFGVGQLNFDPGSILSSTDLTNNIFNQSLSLPAADVQYLAQNRSFQDIDIVSTGDLLNGQSLALNSIGTASTANLRYVFPDSFTVDSGASLTAAPYVSVALDPGVTLTDDGTTTFGKGDAVALGGPVNLTTKILVDGLMNASGTAFSGADNNEFGLNEIEVASGGELTSSGSTFGVGQLNFDPGSNLSSTDLTNNIFNLPISLPAGDVQFLANNQSFQDIDILPGSISGTTLALDSIGTASTVSLRYVFATSPVSSNFTVQSDAMLTAAPDVSVALDPGVTLTDDGTISFGKGDAVALGGPVNVTTKILVNGVMNASGAAFIGNDNNEFGLNEIEVASGGQLTANSSTFGIGQLNLDAGSNDTLSGDGVSAQFTINSGATINIANNDFGKIVANGLIAVGSPSSTINLINNYWEGKDPAGIILDHADDSTRPTVLYNPILTRRPTTITTTDATTTFDGAANTLKLSATVTSPSGNVSEGTTTFTVLNGGNPVGNPVTVNVVGGAANANYVLPAATPGGSYTIEAAYNGDGNYIASTDATHNLTISAAASTTAAVDAATAFSSSAQMVALNATVTSPAGIVNDGTETFTVLNGMTVVGNAVTVNVTNGAAAANYRLPAGTPIASYTIEADYNGDSNYIASSDASHFLYVSAVTSTAGSSTSTTYNAAAQTIVLTATVTSGTNPVNEGAETFTILNGMSVVGTAVTVNVMSGAASANYTLPGGTPGGSYTIQAVYDGDHNFFTSTDASQVLTVNPAFTTTAAADASTTFSQSDQTVALTAKVTSAAGTVNGGTETFTILNGSTIIGSPVTVNVTNGAALAEYVLPGGVSEGAYSIEADYNGNASFLATSEASHVLNVFPVISTAILKSDGSLYQYNALTGMTLLSPAGTILSVSAIADSAGNTDVYAITSDSHLWEHTVSGWSMLSTGSFKQLSAAANSAGNAVVFAVLTDHSLWENSSLFPGTHWKMLSPAGTILSISAVTDAAGHDDVYAVTSDTHLWEHTPSGWSMLSVGSFQQISAGLNTAGQAIVFAVLTDHSLWENNPAFSGNPWHNLSPAGTILSVSAGSADDVFAITSDKRLWEHTTTGWLFHSAGSFASISGATDRIGQGEVFAVLTDSSFWEYDPDFPGWRELVPSGVALGSAGRT